MRAFGSGHFGCYRQSEENPTHQRYRNVILTNALISLDKLSKGIIHRRGLIIPQRRLKPVKWASFKTGSLWAYCLAALKYSLTVFQLITLKNALIYSGLRFWYFR